MAQPHSHVEQSLDNPAFKGFRSIRIPKGLTRSDGIFSIQMNGDSLKDAHILNGDIIVLRPASSLDFDGQLAAVQLPQGITVKFIWLDRGMAILQSRNPKFQLIELPLGQVKIIGTAVRIERDLPLLK